MTDNNSIGDAAEHVAEKVAEYEEGVEGFVQERPLTALGISFLVGLVLARIVF